MSSHAEALAKATLGTVRVFEGARAAAEHDVDIVAATSLLIGQIQQFPASPQLAFVIGAGLLQVGMTEQALRWARWIEDCSDTVGDRALVAVPALLRAAAAVSAGPAGRRHPRRRGGRRVLRAGRPAHAPRPGARRP